MNLALLKTLGTNIGSSISSSGLLSAASKVAGKLSIPNSPLKINSDSLKWMDKLSSAMNSSMGKRVTDSIKDGSLFQLASMAATTFGARPFTENRQDIRPQLNFEQGHDGQDLNLASVDMQVNGGPLQRWGTAPGAADPASPPQAQPSEARPPLPQRPPIKTGLTTVGLGLSNLPISPKVRPSQEVYKAATNPVSRAPDSKVDASDGLKRMLSGIDSEVQNSKDLQAAAAVIASERPEEGYSKPRLSHEEYEKAINAKGT